MSWVVLELPQAPQADEKCGFCKYREQARPEPANKDPHIYVRFKINKNLAGLFQHPKMGQAPEIFKGVCSGTEEHCAVFCPGREIRAMILS